MSTKDTESRPVELPPASPSAKKDVADEAAPGLDTASAPANAGVPLGIPENDDPHHEFAMLGGLNDTELSESLKQHTAALRAALARYKPDLATTLWHDLGPDGLLVIFRSINHSALETFLRDHRTPMPRRPAKPDAIAIYKRGNAAGPNRIGSFLHWLGLSISYRVGNFIEDDDFDGFEKWRTDYPDAVLAAAISGDFFCHKSSGARALRTLRWTGLMPKMLAADPDIAKHEKAIEAVVTEGTNRVRSMERQSRTAELAEDLALGLVSADVATDAVRAAFAAACAALDTEAHNLDEFFGVASLPEFPGREPIEGTRRTLAALDALGNAARGALEARGIENLPALEVWQQALELYEEVEAKTAKTKLGQKMATVTGPAGLAELLSRLADDATDPEALLRPLCVSLEALIDAANTPDADPMALSPLELEARAADPDGTFAPVITAALMGRLSFVLEAPDAEIGESEPEPVRPPTAVPTELSPTPREAATVKTPPHPSLPQPSSSDEIEPAEADAGTPSVNRHEAVSAPQAVASPAASQTTRTAPDPEIPSASLLTKPDASAERKVRLDVALEAIEESAPGEYYEAGIARAIDAGDLGVACWAANAAGMPDKLLSLAHVATSLRRPRGTLSEVAGNLAAEVLGSNFEGSSRPGQLVGWAAATLGAVIAPETALGDVAERLASMLVIDEAVELASAVQHVARRGFSLPEHGLGVVADLAALEEEVESKARAVGERLAPKRFKFSLASAVWNEWTAPGGLLAPFAKAASDDRKALAVMQALVNTLSEKRAIEHAMDDSEGRLRTKNSTKRIEGSAKQHLLSAGRDAVEAASAWCRAVAAHEKRATAAHGADEEAAAALRIAADRVRQGLLGSFGADEPGAAGAREVLGIFYALVDGTPIDGAELEWAQLIAEPLARSAQRMAPDYSPLGTLDFDAVLVGLERTAAEGFALKLSDNDFVAATVLLAVLDAAGAGTPEIDEAYEKAVETARTRAGREAKAAQVLLERARRQLYVTEDVYAGLSGRLAQAANAARPSGRLDIDAALEELAELEALLDAARADSLERFETETRSLRAEKPEFAAKVAALLEQGDLATAVELKEAIERGDELAESSEDSFIVTTFFPAVPDALGAGIDDKLLEAVAARESFGPLDFGPLTTEAADRTTEAFEGWNQLLHSKAVASSANELRVLKPSLRLLGIEAKGIDRSATKDIPASPQRRWFDLTGVSPTGKALVPAFGSGSAGRVRVMVVSGKPSADLVCEWVRQDRSGRAVLVLHAGTMSSSVRHALATKMRKAADTTTAVVDDAVLAWLGAQQGGSRFDLTMRSTLPFAHANPYLPPSGDCPVEMFYGRGAQVQDVQRATGTCLVYGGRQLGKSALLKTAMREFNSVHNQHAIYIDLKAPIEASRTPEAVWRLIAERLAEIGTMSLPRTIPKNPRPSVVSAINAWLDAHETGRILVLLDEADLYFDLDAKSNFVVTSDLKDLMDQRGRRFKVVWAGLHQVRRFATVSNHPIAHLGTASVIGQLDPTPAYRLIEQPTSALGLRFASDALVNRILAYCNYQPVLLHLFAQALLESVYNKDRGSDTAMPQVLTEANVEAVADSPILQAAVRERLHWTLELDPRYKVITYAAAFEAHNQGEGVPLSSHELRNASERWWRAGFADVDPAEFRSLLEELAGLGVLSVDADGEGWRLRSANVVRLLGTIQQVEDKLLEEEEREPTVLVAGEVREPIGHGARSPISAAQLADLVGTGSNQVRIVVGSAATCADQLRPSLDFEASKPSAPFKLVCPADRRSFIRALGQGSDTHQRVIFSDLRRVGSVGCAESLAAALDTPPPFGTRSVVFLVDAAQAEFWAPYIEPRRATPGLEVLALRRYDRSSLRAWATSHDAAFQDESDRTELLHLTGGWPHLIALTDRAIAENPSSAAALVVVRAHLDSEPELGDVLVSVLDEAPTYLRELFTMLAESPETLMSPEDLTEVAEGTCDDPTRIVPMLRGLGALQVDAEGKVSAEPRLAKAWLALQLSE